MHGKRWKPGGVLPSGGVLRVAQGCPLSSAIGSPDRRTPSMGKKGFRGPPFICRRRDNGGDPGPDTNVGQGRTDRGTLARCPGDDGRESSLHLYRKSPHRNRNGDFPLFFCLSDSDLVLTFQTQRWTRTQRPPQETTPIHRRQAGRNGCYLVETMGLEPMTSRM